MTAETDLETIINCRYDYLSVSSDVPSFSETEKCLKQLLPIAHEYRFNLAQILWQMVPYYQNMTAAQLKKYGSGFDRLSFLEFADQSFKAPSTRRWQSESYNPDSFFTCLSAVLRKAIEEGEIRFNFEITPENLRSRVIETMKKSVMENNGVMINVLRERIWGVFESAIEEESHLDYFSPELASWFKSCRDRNDNPRGDLGHIREQLLSYLNTGGIFHYLEDLRKPTVWTSDLEAKICQTIIPANICIYQYGNTVRYGGEHDFTINLLHHGYHWMRLA
ncbi:MAG: hypothetical protein HRT90_00220 [Candidatus Margulisbacteria bacterium]|nr:hypothetical protein [Candidatus Margulisiibacteriota bacterium]